MIGIKGTVKTLTLKSKYLEGNLLGDPIERKVGLYLPPGYQESQNYPLLMALSPYNSSGLAYLDWKPFKGSLIDRLDRLIITGKMAPLTVAFPDCFTRLGGNQYLDSIAVGLYESFLIKEVLPAIEAQFNVGGEGRRGCFGKSSGGFGAITYGMRYPQVWSAIACHSGGMGFQWLFLCYVPQILNELAKHDYNIQKFLVHIEQQYKLTESEFLCLMNLSFAAAYDPDPTQFLGIRLPVDLYSGELIPERWKNWEAYDPAIAAAHFTNNLRQLKGIFIDCGDRDQYHLHFGARRLHRVLEENDIKHVYEEFSDNHTNLDYRFDVSLPFLGQALS